jgi:hypothetical protein
MNAMWTVRQFGRDRYQETQLFPLVGQLLLNLEHGDDESRPKMGGLGCFCVRLFVVLFDEVLVGDMEI